jgi:hypothetical protein
MRRIDPNLPDEPGEALDPAEMPPGFEPIFDEGRKETGITPKRYPAPDEAALEAAEALLGEWASVAWSIQRSDPALLARLNNLHGALPPALEVYLQTITYPAYQTLHNLLTQWQLRYLADEQSRERNRQASEETWYTLRQGAVSEQDLVLALRAKGLAPVRRYLGEVCEMFTSLANWIPEEHHRTYSRLAAWKGGEKAKALHQAVLAVFGEVSVWPPVPVEPVQPPAQATAPVAHGPDLYPAITWGKK